MKTYTILTLVPAMFCMTAPAMAAESLCSPVEKVFFTCSLGKKIVSICASADYPAPSAGFQYRFGPKGAAEMVWPEPATSRTGVTFGNIAYSGGGLGYIRFAREDTDYIVYSGTGRGWEKEGVMVEKDGKRIADHRCKDAANQDLWHTSLPEDDNDRKNAIADAIP